MPHGMATKAKQKRPVTAPQCRRNQVRLCESVKSGTNRRNDCEIVMTSSLPFTAYVNSFKLAKVEVIFFFKTHNKMLGTQGRELFTQK